MKPLIREPGTPILGAALIASLGIYCPIPLLRGAVFGLFPGIAQRSLRTAAKGAVFGALFDLAYIFVWCEIIATVVLRMFWEPRSSFNEFLAFWLPGRLGVVTHMGSPWPNALQFWMGVLVWFLFMVLCWWLVWRPRLPVRRLMRAWLVAAASVSVACGVLWGVSPMDHWWHYGHKSFGIALQGLPWLIVFLGMFPICGLLVACCFKTSAEQFGPANSGPLARPAAADL